MAITNFEELTVELSEEEIQMSTIILNRMKQKYNCRESVITGKEIVGGMKSKGYKMTEVRLRKIVNYLRKLSEPIIAINSGYFYTTDRLELEKQIISLEERAGAILAASYGLKKYLNYAK